MMNQKTKYTFLRSIEEHEGEWGWYQFEHAFPPGWFADEPAGTTARGFLKQLEAEGLVATTPGEPRQKYHLTDQGRAALVRIDKELASG